MTSRASRLADLGALRLALLTEQRRALLPRPKTKRLNQIDADLRRVTHAILACGPAASRPNQGECNARPYDKPV